MMKFLKWFGLTLSMMVLWLAMNVISTKQGWFASTVAPANDHGAFMTAMQQSIDNKSNGNAVMLLIEDGKIFDEYSFSKGEPVNKDTVFATASLGKWVAAVAIMTLVEQGKLDLDTPVSSYLTRWQLPKSDFDNNGVTIRRLLSHTAGITDGLGHDGFLTKAQVQPLTEHLTQALDAGHGVSGKVAVGIQPGSGFKYSGGSYNLLQLIVEEVSGLSFSAYMQKAVFDPLGMTNTGYEQEKLTQLAQYFDDGKLVKYPYYTSLAATGLYSSAADLYKFVAWQLSVTVDSEEALLSKSTLEQMRTPHASTMGIDIWGLGTMLFADNNQDDFIFGHGGIGPSLNATVRVNPATSNGIIMLETGNRALASDTATQWTLWETGNPDMYMLKNMIPPMLKRVLVGCVLILIVSLIIVWRNRKIKRLAGK